MLRLSGADDAGMQSNDGGSVRRFAPLIDDLHTVHGEPLDFTRQEEP